MFRLLFSLVIVVALWPIDENNQALGLPGESVSSFDVAAAAYSVASDLGQFCTRNPQACETAGEIASNAAQKIGQIVVSATESSGELDQN